MKLKRMLAMAMAGAFTASLAYAEGSRADKARASSLGASSTPMFQELDKNRDGYLSKDEGKGAPWAKDFAKLDTNHDGKLSRQEYAAAPELKGAAIGGSGGSDRPREQESVDARNKPRSA